MRRLANWALGGDNSSSSDSDHDEDGSRGTGRRSPGVSQASSAAYFSRSWRAATPPPGSAKPHPNSTTTTTTTTRAKDITRPLPPARTQRDAVVRAYLDGVTAVPPEVELIGGAHDWLLEHHDEAPPLERELSMEDHFQAQLGELAKHYQVAPDLLAEHIDEDGRGGDLSVPAFERVDRGPLDWLWRGQATERDGITDSRPRTPPSQSATTATAASAQTDSYAATKNANGSALWWLVKAILTRSSPTPARGAGTDAIDDPVTGHDDDELGAVGGITPPLFELTYDPAPQTFFPAHAAPRPSTPPPVTRSLFVAGTPPTSTTTPRTPPAAQTTAEASDTHDGTTAVMAELVRLAALPVPGATAATTDHDGAEEDEATAAHPTESAIRSRFNSLFAGTTTTMTTVTIEAEEPPQRVCFGAATITSDEPSVAQQIARLSERYLPPA